MAARLNPTGHRPQPRLRRQAGPAQRGATLTEFVLVAPILLLVSLLIIHMTFMYTTRNVVNHATFMAARAGSVSNANVWDMRQAFIQNILPLYGGGVDGVELAAARQAAELDVDLMEQVLQRRVVERINPSTLSFADWADPTVEVPNRPGRTIPHTGLNFRATTVGVNSGQTIQDANLLRIKITYGMPSRIPYVLQLVYRPLYAAQAALGQARAEEQLLLGVDRFTIRSYATLHMQSDAVEN